MSDSFSYGNAYRANAAEATRYYELCDRALALGVPVSLDDTSTPPTVRGLRKAVRRAERSAVTI